MAVTIFQKLGGRLYRLRKEKRNPKISQGEMAKKIKLSTAYIGMIERGERSPSVETLAKMCSVIGITLADLFAFTKYTHAGHEGADERLHDIHDMVIKGQLTITDLETVVDMCKAIYRNKKK